MNSPVFPEIFNRGHEVINRAPEDCNRAPKINNRESEVINRVPEVCNREPEDCNRAPTAPDVERAVIGEMILEPGETIRPVIEAGGPDLFYDGYYLLMFRALDHMYEHGEPIDQLTFTEQLRKDGDLETVGGEPAVGEICAETGSAANIHGHIAILRDKAHLRKIINAVTTARNACPEPAADGTDILEQLREDIRGLREFQSGKNLTLVKKRRSCVGV